MVGSGGDVKPQWTSRIEKVAAAFSDAGGGERAAHRLVSGSRRAWAPGAAWVWVLGRARPLSSSSSVCLSGARGGPLQLKTWLAVENVGLSD